ncbi:MAG: hypothetical protein ACHQAQ_19690 [Hyphomicrobiales bacterium]
MSSTPGSSSPWLGELRKIGRRAACIVLLGSAIGLAVPSVAAEPKLSDLVPVKLVAGPNKVAQFMPDGRDALITLGWRDNGNAHGYDLYLVMLPTKPKGNDWNVVGIFPSGFESRLEDTIRDDPHMGEDVVRSVRFARGKLDGKPAALLVVATRETDIEVGIPGPSFTSFEVYRLTHSDAGMGTTADYFERVLQSRSTTKFCNAEMALFKRFGLALPAGYAGPRTEDGCS